MKVNSVLLTLLHIATACLSFAPAAHAVPVLNENQAINSSATFYPDSADPNHFYYVPQYLGICADEHGAPIFSYTEVKTDGFFSRPQGLVQTTLCMKEHDADMKAAMTGILAKNANATFSGLPFTKSQINFSDAVFSQLTVANSCTNIAGVMGQEESCSILFKADTKATFVRALESGLAVVLQFQYVVDGVNRLPDGLKPFQASFGVAARISKSDFNGHLDDYIHR